MAPSPHPQKTYSRLPPEAHHLWIGRQGEDYLPQSRERSVDGHGFLRSYAFLGLGRAGRHLQVLYMNQARLKAASATTALKLYVNMQ